MAASPDLLVWIDCEMTGLDLSVDELVEVAVVITDYDLVPVDPLTPSETARRYRFADGGPGELGFITTITQPFCDGCSRLRLTADGRLRTCLFSARSHDIKSRVRSGASADELKRFIVETALTKEAAHGINVPGFTPSAESMSSIGG